MPMQCPHLSVNDGKKTCKRMEGVGINGEVSDFDIQHYCQSNPFNCYYFRASEKQTTVQSEKTLKHKLSQFFTTP